MGKRATLWLNELYIDFEEIEHRIATLALRGSKGTTGTQASFVELLGGDSEKIRQIERDIASEMGFSLSLIHILTPELDTRVELAVDAFLPESYVPEEKLRVEIYKRCLLYTSNQATDGTINLTILKLDRT